MTRHPQSQFGPQDQNRQGHDTNQGVAPLQGRQGMPQGHHLLVILLRHLGNRQTEEVFELQGGNHDADPHGKAEGHLQWYVTDQSPQPPHGHQGEHHPAEQGGHQQTGDAKLLRYWIEDDHEGRGRP